MAKHTIETNTRGQKKALKFPPEPSPI